MKRQTITPTRGQAATPKRAVAEIDPSEAARMQLLIQAAEKIFLDKGFHAATMNDVAKAAGMSKKTVYKLIESKAALFSALIEHHAGKLTMPAIAENWTVDETLVQILLRIGEFILMPDQISLTRLMMAEYAHSNDFCRILHQRRVKRAKAMLEQKLLEVRPPEYSKAAQIGEMGAMLFGMALGEFYLSALVSFRPVPTKAALTRRIRHAVDMFLSSCK